MKMDGGIGLCGKRFLLPEDMAVKRTWNRIIGVGGEK